MAGYPLHVETWFSQLIDTFSACFWYQTKAIYQHILIIIYSLDYVGNESIDTLIHNKYEQYLGGPLRDHGKMGIGLLTFL
jgi:hypothetical protein